ncbi:uncharacterized protein LOC144194018 isoform X2 [Stigmatopora nigra]
MFPSVRFKAIDYVFEASNSIKVTKNLLALPTPKLTFREDHYLHSCPPGNVAYRMSWVTEKPFSICTLSASVLDDFRRITQHNNSTETLDVPGSIKYKMESPRTFPEELTKLLHWSDGSCMESFFQLNVQTEPAKRNKDMFLPEEIIATNFLPRFNHLPSLKHMLSRLKTILVVDPLITLSEVLVTQQTILGCHESYCAPNGWLNDVEHVVCNTEKFSEESPTESLLLPELLLPKTTADHTGSISSIRHLLNVGAEQLDEHFLNLQDLFKNDPALVEISQFSSVEKISKDDWTEDNFPERIMHPTKLDVLLIPSSAVSSYYSCRPSVCNLQKEVLSTQGTISLVSDLDKLESTVWLAEKYPGNLLHLMFEEIDLEEAAFDFQPLNRALNLINLKSLVLEIETEACFGNIQESLEALSINVPTHEEDHISEEFQKVLLEPVEHYTSCQLSLQRGECQHNSTGSSSTVIQVQATDSQRLAYDELFSLAQPFLSCAKKLGLNVPAWRDFKHLAPDQTRDVLKQQEIGLRKRTPVVEGDEAQLFNTVLVIHMLVKAKELLLKCHLSAAVDYLSKSTKKCPDKDLCLLLRRLHVILHLSCRNNESNIKLLKLQDLAVAWIHNEKILVITSLNYGESSSTIMQVLKKVTSVSVVHPNNNEGKLKAAIVVSSVQDNRFVLVYEQHLGPDFPWNLFSLVVEYDCLTPSLWAATCKNRRVPHLTFDTVLPNRASTDEEEGLEDKVAYLVLVTDTLLNNPALLQTLESSYNITLLERSHCMSLQLLGITNHFSVITVDESTAIVVQDQDAMCEERAYEVVVRGLIALALQYNRCWIILHCPDCKGGGFSNNASRNLAAVYSSFVLLKLEDLDVKVLIATKVLEVARWVNRICFLSLMSSKHDISIHLERDWLSITPSLEEQCLSTFPCVNPLVAQLMLRRAPSLQWLLSAPLNQIEEMFPEVPLKIIKLFRNATLMCEAQMVRSGQDPDSEKITFNCNLKWTDQSSHLHGFFGAQQLNYRTSQGIVVAGWTDPAQTVSRVVKSGRSTQLQQRLGYSVTNFNHLTVPSQIQLEKGGSTKSGLDMGSGLSAEYESRCWLRQERKRSEQIAGLPAMAVTPLKKSRLS